MNARSFGGQLCALAAASILASCGGSAMPLRPSGDVVSSLRRAAKAQSLLYVSDLGANAVDVFSYPALKAMGSLHDFGSVAGLCTDKAGDVFVVDEDGPVVVYAHGGTTPIRTLSGSGAPYGCSVDSASGDLAVTQLSSYEDGAVSVYAKAKGKAKAYFNKKIDATFYCGYDASGNLFADGWDRYGKFIVTELPKGDSSLKLFYPGKSVTHPGGVQWDGKYLAVGNQDAGLIYRTTKTGTIASTVTLKGGTNVEQFWLDGSTLIGPIAASPGVVGFWHYPAGGASTKTLAGFSYPIAATVSTAP